MGKPLSAAITWNARQEIFRHWSHVGLVSLICAACLLVAFLPSTLRPLDETATESYYSLLSLYSILFAAIFPARLMGKTMALRAASIGSLPISVSGFAWRHFLGQAQAFSLGFSVIWLVQSTALTVLLPMATNSHELSQPLWAQRLMTLAGPTVVAYCQGAILLCLARLLAQMLPLLGALLVLFALLVGSQFLSIEASHIIDTHPMSWSTALMAIVPMLQPWDSYSGPSAWGVPGRELGWLLLHSVLMVTLLNLLCGWLLGSSRGRLTPLDHTQGSK